MKIDWMPLVQPSLLKYNFVYHATEVVDQCFFCFSPISDSQAMDDELNSGRSHKHGGYGASGIIFTLGGQVPGLSSGPLVGSELLSFSVILGHHLSCAA